MSSISYIYSSQSASISNYKGDELSTSTKLRLEALGIDPSYVSTESQAQILIAQVEAAPKQNSSGKQQGGNSSREQLVLEAKNLAKKISANYNHHDSLEILLEKISNKLNILAKEPQNVEQVQVYQAELSDIAQRADILINTQQNIFNELNMISINNRIILGL